MQLHFDYNMPFDWLENSDFLYNHDKTNHNKTDMKNAITF